MQHQYYFPQLNVPILEHKQKEAKTKANRKTKLCQEYTIKYKEFDKYLVYKHLISM